jgi:RNA polymerase sigma-70 factor (ECF subfamily)
MTTSITDAETLLVEQVRKGDARAWETLIARYEGRLVAFAEHRLSNRSQVDDIVQETFIGFLNSLPHFDGQRSLESYLFSICAYKLTDHLRRTGRRDIRSLDSGTPNESSLAERLPGRLRVASSIARSGEQREREEKVIVSVLQEQIAKWKKQADWLKLMCLELVVVAGMPNREVASTLNISEQKVANYKSDFIARTKSQLSRLNFTEDLMEKNT